MYQRVLFWVVFVLMLVFAGCQANDLPDLLQESVSPDITSTAKSLELASQSSLEGPVSVEVTPLTVFGVDEFVDFAVVLSTHSVDLAYDLTELVVMVDGSGQEYSPVQWEGDPLGGHHREGVLRFARPVEIGSSFEIKIRSIGEVDERFFKWDLPEPTRDISSEVLEGWLDAKDFKLVDVHIPVQSHIMGTDAVIPFDKLDQILAFLPDKNEKVVLYCRSGSMSRQVASELVARGYTNVYNLENGLNEWIAQGRVVEL